MSFFSQLTQNIRVSVDNSSTANLGASATFTGAADSTLGIVGIQVSLKTDQNCTVYIDQSPDGTNWDIVDDYTYHELESNFGVTVQAINSYFRIRVKNSSSTTATTYFRLQSVLCPIVEAVPRSLDEDGYLQVGVKSIKDEYGFGVENTPMDEMRVVTPFRLVGATFTGTTLDPNFWDAVTGTVAPGSVSQTGGQLILSTGASATGSAIIQSIKSARYTGGASNRYRAIIRLGDTGAVGNIRKWGMFSSTNGAYFQLSGTTLSVVTLKAGVETSNVASTAWNTNRSVPTITAGHTYEIYITNISVYFVINGTLRHKSSFTSSTWTATTTLPVRTENTNGAGAAATAYTMEIRTQTIYRLGAESTAPRYAHISTATTNILKYGAGRLHKICVNNSTNNNITIYDNTSAVAPIIAIINPGSSATPFVIDYHADFSTGLTIVTAGTPDITVIYE